MGTDALDKGNPNAPAQQCGPGTFGILYSRRDSARLYASTQSALEDSIFAPVRVKTPPFPSFNLKLKTISTGKSKLIRAFVEMGETPSSLSQIRAHLARIAAADGFAAADKAAAALQLPHLIRGPLMADVAAAAMDPDRPSRSPPSSTRGALRASLAASSALGSGTAALPESPPPARSPPRRLAMDALAAAAPLREVADRGGAPGGAAGDCGGYPPLPSARIFVYPEQPPSRGEMLHRLKREMLRSGSDGSFGSVVAPALGEHPLLGRDPEPTSVRDYSNFTAPSKPVVVTQRSRAPSAAAARAGAAGGGGPPAAEGGEGGDKKGARPSVRISVTAHSSEGEEEEHEKLPVTPWPAWMRPDGAEESSEEEEEEEENGGEGRGGGEGGGRGAGGSSDSDEDAYAMLAEAQRRRAAAAEAKAERKRARREAAAADKAATAAEAAAASRTRSKSDAAQLPRGSSLAGGGGALRPSTSTSGLLELVHAGRTPHVEPSGEGESKFFNPLLHNARARASPAEVAATPQASPPAPDAFSGAYPIRGGGDGGGNGHSAPSPPVQAYPALAHPAPAEGSRFLWAPEAATEPAAVGVEEEEAPDAYDAAFAERLAAGVHPVTCVLGAFYYSRAPPPPLPPPTHPPTTRPFLISAPPSSHTRAPPPSPQLLPRWRSRCTQ